MNEDRLAKFAEVYERQLREAVTNYPDEYYWPVENVPIVAAKMIAAVRRDNYNKDSRAFKATCKELGIKFTYTAIREYLHG